MYRKTPNLELMLYSGFHIVGMKENGIETYKKEDKWLKYNRKKDEITLYYTYLGSKRLILDKNKLWIEGLEKH